MATLAVTGFLAEPGGGKAVLLQVDRKDHVYPIVAKQPLVGTRERLISRGSEPY